MNLRPAIVLLCFLLSTVSNTLFAADKAKIRISAGHSRPDPELMHGYQHLQHGNFAAAQQAYEKALRSEPNNPELLLTLAALAEQQGQHASALDYRQAALAANPLDARVQAALLNRREYSSAQGESRLKILISQQPQCAELHFALGNLYARQKRWAEAQAAYFLAAASDQGNPDYHFNLAISLDQMGQEELAGEHYHQAISAALLRLGSFSKAQVEQRLQELAR